MEEQTSPSPDQPVVTKTGTCPSLSGASILTYEIGATEKDSFFRITANTAAGLFCKEWIPLSQITDLLSTGVPASRILKPLYEGKSSNSPGFLLAVLKAEGIVELVEGKKHQHTAVLPDKVAKPKKGKKTEEEG